jgi:hypothetical protein
LKRACGIDNKVWRSISDMCFYIPIAIEEYGRFPRSGGQLFAESFGF